MAPLDLETIGASVDKTGRLLVVQEAPFAGSWGATVVAALMRDRFESFECPPRSCAATPRRCRTAGGLEDVVAVTPDRIVTGVQTLTRR